MPGDKPDPNSSQYQNTGGASDLLGVPKGYVPTHLPGGPGESGSREPNLNLPSYKPLYHKGDESKPGNSGTQNIIAIQRKLVMAGYLTPDNLVGEFGVWHKNTEAAYMALLEDANKAGVDADTQFTRGATQRIPGVTFDENGNIVQGAGGPNIPPLTIQQPNADDVARVFRAAVIDKLGAGWSDDQIQGMVDQYLSTSQDIQQQAYMSQVAQAEAMAAGANGPTAPAAISGQVPSPDTYIEDKLRKEHPVEMQAQTAMDNFVNNATAFWKSPV